MQRSAQAWLLRWLDGLLTEGQRQAPAEELRRYRLLAGAAATCAVLTATGLGALEVLGRSEGLRAVGVGVTLGYLGVLGLLRRARSPRPPGLLLCAIAAAGLTAIPLVMGTSQAATHAFHMMMPLLAVYLLGPRLGFAFTGLLMVNILLVQPLARSDLGLGPLADPEGWAMRACAVLSLVGAWGMSWVHGAGRDEAHVALERALRTLRESEGKLVSLIESTDDLVCALDTQGRLVSANQAARVLFLQKLGREPRPGEPMALVPFTPPEQEHWRERLAQAARGERVREELSFALGARRVTLELTVNAVREGPGEVVGLTLFGRDITERREAEARLSELHRSMLEVSRQAGMAEFATGILHNVGNALNSVNVSAGVVSEGLRGLRVERLSQATELLQRGAAQPGFLTEDARGRQLPTYLATLSQQFTQEREGLLTEMQVLRDNVEHIKAVVGMQQAHARAMGVEEEVEVPQLIRDALRLHAESFEKQGIQVRCEYAQVPPLLADRHKLLQILLNLLSNARHALLESPREDKRLSIQVRPGAGEGLRIEVADNGTGIAPEHLPRLFTQGFTTKRTGHGFGLHISALTATEMKGSLTCHSAGPGQGATFVLELPRA
jgi:PAS domain S-box-containing protein